VPWRWPTRDFGAILGTGAGQAGCLQDGARLIGKPLFGMEPEEKGRVQVREEEEERLIEKLRKIETLFARATNAGERAAAESARDRIRGGLEQLEKSERPVEYRFSLPDGWSKSLFIALLRRYGIKPYRYSGQRRTTVMARVTRTFADEVLWPEFQELNATLRSHLDSVTKRVIAVAIHGDQADAEERSGQEPKGRSAQGFLGAE